MTKNIENIEFLSAKEPVDYPDAVAFMEQRIADIHAGLQPQTIWFVEHPPLYTAGTSAKDIDLLDHSLPVYKTGRGGQYTYHGFGQRVVYVMLDLKSYQHEPDIKDFIWRLEEWIIQTLSLLNIHSERRDGRVGIWVSPLNHPILSIESKIAAIGVRIRHWVTYHGIAININPDLSKFSGIVPCGLSEYGVTSIEQLGLSISFEQLDHALKKTFPSVFTAL
jgi:lipoyl(octanoyl) transferase